MRKTPILSLAIGATLIAGLAGCTAGTHDATSSKTPAPSATTKADPFTGGPENGKCVDGNAIIVATDKQKKFELAAGCDNVSIVGVGAEVTLGDVKNLVFEGNESKVTAGNVDTVAFGGNKNALTHKGSAPQVNDQGKENTVSAA